MKGESLLGGASRAARPRRMRPEDEESGPVVVGYGFLSALVLVAALFAGLGVFKVHTVFTVRDYEIETGRLQQLAQERGDRHRALVARISQLHRAEYLRTAAVEGLGLVDPEPRQMETVVVPAEVVSRWSEAASARRLEDLEKEAVK